jgi:hypothetical protein
MFWLVVSVLNGASNVSRNHSLKLFNFSVEKIILDEIGALAMVMTSRPQCNIIDVSRFMYYSKTCN